jgi:hypothetical protein
MAVTAAFVIVATLAAERAGPLIGGLIATLPISAGPAYVFIALDHDAAFLSESAFKSLVTNPVIAVFAIVYAMLARLQSLAVSLGAAFLGWLTLVLLFERFVANLPQALLLNAVVLSACLWIARPLRHAVIPRLETYWYDISLRAVLVAALVGCVVGLSFTIGPSATGVLAVFPIVLTSVIVILHRRIGGMAASAVLANTVLGLVGFGLCLLTMHLTAIPLGPPIALPLALAVSFGWGLSVVGVRRFMASATAP